MQNIEWIIQNLDDAFRKSINYENRMWLYKNAEKIKIKVISENCVANVFEVVEVYNMTNSKLIQQGKEVSFQHNFNPFKEALLLIPNKIDPLVYYIKLYSPIQYTKINNNK